MLSLCKNKVFMCAVMGVTIRMLYTIGLFTFLIKILILKFGVDASKAGQTLGIIMVPSLIGKRNFSLFVKFHFDIKCDLKCKELICDETKHFKEGNKLENK